MAVARPGSYHIEARDQVTQAGMLAVGESRGLIAMVVLGFLVAIPVFVIGLILLIVGLVRRRVCR